MSKPLKVWVRGAGELASGTVVSLHRSGFRVWLSELEYPLAIRRTVCFSDAVFEGRAAVEEVRGVLAEVGDVPRLLAEGVVPVLIDDPTRILRLEPDVVVDARMLKRDDPSLFRLAPFTVGLGPGFIAGRSCHAVIETMRGHDLGRIIWEGAASADTGTPGVIGGESERRVLFAPAGGAVSWEVDFGDIVREGGRLGVVGGVEIVSKLDGMVRGLISPRVPVTRGMKIGDVDPRGDGVDCHSISDKARAVGRGVLEAILVHRERSDRREETSTGTGEG